MKNLTNLEEVILVAADRIKPRGGLIAFSDLYKSLPQSRSVIKRALLSLEEKQIIAFQRHNFPRAASREERKAMIHRGSDYYVGFAIRNPNVKKKTTKKKTAKRAPTPAQLKARANFAAAAKARSKAAKAKAKPRKRNTTIIKARRVKIAVTNPKKRIARNPYAYQIQYKTGSGGFKHLGAFPANSRSQALKMAESELKRKGLWTRSTKLITGAVPLASSAARHRNQSKPRKRNSAAAAKVKQIREDFSGQPVRRRDVMQVPDGTPKELAKLGALASIKTDSGTITPQEPLWLCADANGKLHLAATTPWPAAGSAKNFGEVEEVEYIEKKPHLGYRNRILFFHKLGEVSGRKPSLHSDGRYLRFKGGNYKITPEGIID